MSVILCTAGYDHTIRFWEALSGICSRTIQHSDSQVNRLCISPDKRYLAAAGRHSVKLFDIKNPNPNPVSTFEGHSGNVTGVGFHCEGKWMVTSSEDWTVKVWDTRTANVQRNYVHGFPVNDVVIHPNQGELFSCDRGGNVKVWDLGQNKCTHHLVPEDDVSVASVTIASDGSMLCVGNNRGNVYAWRIIQTGDSTSLVPLARFTAHHQCITRILLSPDVRHLATCSADHTARIWSADILSTPVTSLPINPASKAPPPPPSSSPSSSSSSHSSSSFGDIGGGEAMTIREEEKSSSSSTTPHSSSTPALNRAAPVSTMTTGCTNNTSNVTNTNNNSNTTVVSAPPPPPSTTATTQMPLLSSMATITTTAFPLETTLHGHQRWVWDCAFSADSAYLVTACSDHYARLWELTSQSIIRQYNGHHRGAVCVALNDYSER